MSSVTPMKFPKGLYGVTPDWDDAARLDQSVREAASGGMVALQLRLKTVNPNLRTEIAHQLRTTCSELGVLYIINDDWRLAKAVRADGVHLGRDDGDPAEVRQATGGDMLIGVSCYADLERARQFLDTPVDYIAFGAMYVSATKPAATPAPLSTLSQGLELASHHAKKTESPRPAVVAIGGITSSNAATLIDAGADSLAVIGGLFNAPDIKAAAQRFTSLFQGRKDPNLF